jgi:hypothetical protein
MGIRLRGDNVSEDAWVLSRERERIPFVEPRHSLVAHPEAKAFVEFGSTPG